MSFDNGPYSCVNGPVGKHSEAYTGQRQVLERVHGLEFVYAQGSQMVRELRPMIGVEEVWQLDGYGKAYTYL